uniref:Disease resistance protein At4g27190-like leucine-rich repeats domain-containing protein n=1 Tax=Salix viminalis TaxID=40686 RepID=A0A6N2KQD0_SALVM
MEEIIGGTRSDEEGVMGEESNEFKLPKLRSLRLQGLPELKSICSAKLICDSLQEIKVSKCNSIEIMVPSSWSGLLNLEEITVRECQKMEEIIGGTRSDEKGVIGEESISSEFKFPKLRELNLEDLPELKSICNAKLICISLEVIAVLHCEKLKRIPICLPLLENGQPSPPPSLKVIEIESEEWWESVVEWEQPNAKDVLRPFVTFEPSKGERNMLQRRFLESCLQNQYVSRFRVRLLTEVTGATTGTGTELELILKEDEEEMRAGRGGAPTSDSGSPSSRLMMFQGKLIFNLDMEYHTSLTAIISYLCLNCTSRHIIYWNSYSHFLAELFSLLHCKIN